MLIRYKRNLEKIAMGLLSFMPEEKDVKKLQQTIKEYEENPDWHLFLWKEDDVLGAIGLRIEDDINAVIQHISVNPSHRNSGIGRKMVHAINNMYQDKYAVCAEENIQTFYNKCGQDDKEKEDD
ncbi:GNAT family N-acetyltransferase [Virgibacillus dakarensis]|uniref:Protein RibT n=1 Tax=Lentibacillus populi TaxID=1827502 RepID=A0A9W5X4B3_9BACI|nr:MULTISPECIES: GNAT family N-acetyltransferase [Bacillaceae]MBT2214315.1 GNAT family N-acetyltransferase [Virgibacillus dakarensis]MTW84992.1 GNAT family N-acetyltransferase [Virgibacillus dakarensis]GGB33881.1 protein RibT [Lentibacillus populi]